jgi:type I site-specific restriction endonuclease
VVAGYLNNEDRVRALDGTTPRDHRKDLIAGFRNGSIQFLINCAVLTEGFDAPETACVAVARPTKSRSLYAQMIGRGTRIAEGKEDLLILDFVGNSGLHKLVTPLDVLNGKPLPKDVQRDALALIEEGRPSEEALREAEQRAMERVRAAEEHRRRQAKIQADVAYRARQVNPFIILGVEGNTRGPRATDRQLAVLRNAGVDLSRLPSRRQASNMIDKIMRRRQNGICSFKQARILAKNGLPTDIDFNEANRAITAIADNHWQAPDWLRAEYAEGFR